MCVREVCMYVKGEYIVCERSMYVCERRIYVCVREVCMYVKGENICV